MTLKTALETLEAQKPGILLNDGAEESDREVAIVHAGGRATIQPVTDGYVGTGQPLYDEVEAA